MNRARIIITVLVYLNFYSVCLGMENVFYILRNNSPAQAPSSQKAFSSLQNHFKSIHILISQAYKIDQHGVVSGFPNQATWDFTHNHAMKVMVLVTNTSFDKEKAHQFLSAPLAQQRAIKTLLDVCHKNHYYGVQFDFEGIALNDRNALTHFYVMAAKQLHQQGFAVSFAIVPTDGRQETAFLKRKYENWGGAYDLKKLSEHADFISIMAYDQHTDGTTPGPTASIPWVDADIRYALQFIPAQKISLGIPVYSGHWSTGIHTSSRKISTHLTEMNYEQTKSLLNKYHPKLQWDDNNKMNYAIYQHGWLNEYIFIEDKQSFKAKLALIKKYNLRGMSVFSLGSEDPSVWSAIEKSE